MDIDSAIMVKLYTPNTASPLPLTSSISVPFADHHYQLIVMGLVSAHGALPTLKKNISHDLETLIHM